MIYVEFKTMLTTKLSGLSVCTVLILQCITTACPYLDVNWALRRSQFDDKIVTETRVLWRREELHGSLCVGACSRDDSCVSVFYNKVTGQCQGHSISFHDNGFASDENYSRFYVLPRGENYIGDSCTSVTDCVAPNSQCLHGTCKCMHGYSLNPSTYQCTPYCTTYGNDFLEARDFYIAYLNRNEIDGISLSECMSACRNRTDYTCKSLEYRWSISRCQLSDITYLDHPDQFYEDTANTFTISYFQRDCEF